MKRDRLSERLERRDMIRRRAVIDIPEFYVGSILAVTVSDTQAPGKKNRFVGICIQRSRVGLRANFTLRNVIDGQGTEIRYDLYSPLLLKIEVLKLEKRLDDELLYLRDVPPEHSTVPFDMEPVTLPPGATVPLNTIKVKLNPMPWDRRWEIKNLKGIEEFELPPKKKERANHPQILKTWEKHDLMLQYRSSVNEKETEQIMSEVYSNVKHLEKEKLKKKQSQSSRGIVLPKNGEKK
jgi:large subunit ribosomal protein L19